MIKKYWHVTCIEWNDFSRTLRVYSMRQHARSNKIASLDTRQKLSGLPHYVRVTGIRSQKFVEFDFAIGEPTTFIELVLPFDQYEIFCKKNNAIELTPEQEAEVDFDKLKWRYGAPGIKH